MDVMELFEYLDTFILVNNSTLKNKGDKYTNYAVYDNGEDLDNVIISYLNDQRIKSIELDLLKEDDLNIDLSILANNLVSEKAVLLLKNYGMVDNQIRSRFKCIFDERKVGEIKIEYLGTIVFMGKNKYRLDFDETTYFKALR
ncbi:MAG: hypothetical protein J6Y28_07630 [Acholeplasmatales bacterium]|nr:hypothetical protein [Acholeplasmatales bacterium]